MSAPFEPLDHGVLNVPLHRRGDIDRQLDRHLANERREKKRIAREMAAQIRDERAAAKPAAAELITDAPWLAGLAARLGLSVALTRKALRSDAHWRPAALLRLHARWQREGGGR